MSGYCPKCGTYHEEDDDRLCSACANPADQTPAVQDARMPMKFRTKSTIVESVQFTGPEFIQCKPGTYQVPDGAPYLPFGGTWELLAMNGELRPCIKSHGRTIWLKRGDRIIKFPDGRVDVYSQETFDSVYEPVGDPEKFSLAEYWTQCYADHFDPDLEPEQREELIALFNKALSERGRDLPCGCRICICETQKCHGCGARNCGKHNAAGGAE